MKKKLDKEKLNKYKETNQLLPANTQVVQTVHISTRNFSLVPGSVKMQKEIIFVEISFTPKIIVFTKKFSFGS